MTDNTNLPQELPTDAIEDLVKVLNDYEDLIVQKQDALRKNGVPLPDTMLPALQQLRTSLTSFDRAREIKEAELQRWQAVSHTWEHIYDSLDLDSVLNEVINITLQLTGAEHVCLMLKDLDTGALEFSAGQNIDQDRLAVKEWAIQATIDRVAKDALPICTTNVGMNSLSLSEPVNSLIDYVMFSILCVPLALNGQLFGVLYADQRVKHGIYGDKDLKLLHAFANQAAIAIQNARLFSQLKANLARLQGEVQELRNQLDQKRLNG